MYSLEPVHGTQVSNAGCSHQTADMLSLRTHRQGLVQSLSAKRHSFHAVIAQRFV